MVEQSNHTTVVHFERPIWKSPGTQPPFRGEASHDDMWGLLPMGKKWRGIRRLPCAVTLLTEGPLSKDCDGITQVGN
eukprot:86384-Amphidinium_carterae.1